MNKNLLDFIKAHEKDNIDRLILSKGKWPDIDMDIVVNTIAGRKKMATKLPQWSENDELLYPTRLCTEQCSSYESARYKADIISNLFDHKPKVADLTGGLGVDVWAFASIAETVLHNEANAILSSCVEHNFRSLGIDNVLMSNQMVNADNIDAILSEYKPEIVFMDPARRDSSGKKVFLLEDCSPDVLKLKDRIFEHCRYILLKLSPMADIKMAVNRLGKVKEVHTVAIGGECKELLILMDREYSGSGYEIIVNESSNIMRFSDSEESRASVSFLSASDEIANYILFEPGKAITKAGVFNSLCERLDLIKLGRSTNLYLASGKPDKLRKYGKTFHIKELRSFDNKSLKDVGKSIGWADVSARNIPMSSEELSKKMGLSSKNAKNYATASSVPHIFGLTIDFNDAGSKRVLLVTEVNR